MKYLIIFLFFSIVAAACNPSASLDGCYSGNVGQDSVFLTLARQGDQVVGDMVYQFYERDSNSGQVTGEVVGDSLLLLDYLFSSEGRESKRQMAFLLQNGKLSEGAGPLVEEDEGFVIQDISQFTFGQSFVLSPTPCRKVASGVN